MKYYLFSVLLPNSSQLVGGWGLWYNRRLSAGVAKLADALDSKSSSLYGECGFDSHLRHQVSPVNDLILTDSREHV